jgi:hypothetical protein
VPQHRHIYTLTLSAYFPHLPHFTHSLTSPYSPLISYTLISHTLSNMSSWPIPYPHDWLIDFSSFTPIHPIPIDLSYKECMMRARQSLANYLTAYIMKAAHTHYMEVSTKYKLLPLSLPSQIYSKSLNSQSH